MCLNVNGVTSKWENDIYIKLFVKYDIICLCELKTSYVFSFSGYKCVRSRIVPSEENHGGVAILFSTKLWNHVHCISTYKDQVWFKLMSTSGIKYGCIYIAPRDSLYFKQESYAYVAEQCASNDKVLILGDFNARMSDLSSFSQKERSISFQKNPDIRSNANGRDGLIPINNLCFHEKVFTGGLSYRKEDKWIS